MNTPTRLLGIHGPQVFPLALGCMGMSGMYGAAEEAESLATIHAAIDHGINLFDTGDFYGNGHNELLLGRALRGHRHKVLLSVKYGALRHPTGAFLGIDTSPAATKNFLAHTLTRLGTDYIDIYRPARLDPKVPIEDTIGAIASLVKEGYIRHIGLSEVGPDTIRRAHAVHPIVDLQIEYSLISRSPESAIFPLLAELGIAVTAYGVLSRGLLSGSLPQGQADFRSHLPRFTGENYEKNKLLIATLQQLAADKDVTATQLAFAWVLAKGPTLVPLAGARKRTQLADALAALHITLTTADLAAIEAAIPPDAVAGTRYDSHQMQMLDSERP